jgi:hypothetical protein
VAERSGNRRSNSGQRGDGNGGGRKLSAGQAIEAVRDQLPALLGRPIESVVGVERNQDEDSWAVTVQVVELERIPRSTDVLGAYVVTLDSQGELAGYRRRRRYNRSQADED